MKFRSIRVEDFPPFGSAFFRFPVVKDKPDGLADVHLFVGVNGTGKTRLLTALSALLGNAAPFNQRLKALPKSVSMQAEIQFRPAPGQQIDAGFLFNANSEIAQFGGGNHNAFAVAHNKIPAFAYRGTAYVTDAVLTVLPEIAKPTREACLAFVRPELHSKSLLESIVNVYFKAAVESMDASKAGTEGFVIHDERAPQETGAASSRLVDNPATRMVRAIESAVTSVTGRHFAFRVKTQPKVTVEARWGASELALALLPDGLRSILGWLVHAVVMMDAFLEGKEDPLDTEAIFLLDEIESHLHPTWQRRILPAFQRLFPKAQIFVATHSPFVICSLNHGWIHQLDLQADGRVVPKEPRAASAGDSYVSVLEELMGLPEWYDPETEGLLADFRSKRDLAYQGDESARLEASRLAREIGKRSIELEFMMGRELSQMDHQLQQSSSRS